MPTLPEGPERPAPPSERIGAAMRSAGAAIGADRITPVRVIVCLWLLGMSAAQAPFPWPEVAVIPLVVLVIDFARRH